MAKVKAIKPEKMIKALNAELERERARAKRWKTRAKSLESEIRKATQQIQALEKSLRTQMVAVPARAFTPVKSTQAKPTPPPAATVVTPGSTPAAKRVPSPARKPAATASPTPDATWTVTELRSLAKERQVRGYSSMTKAQLLDALS